VEWGVLDFESRARVTLELASLLSGISLCRSSLIEPGSDFGRFRVIDACGGLCRGVFQLLEAKAFADLFDVAVSDLEHISGKNGSRDVLAGSQADFIVLAIERFGIEGSAAFGAGNGLTVLDDSLAYDLAILVEGDGA
jgi:hypothetical protein